MYLFMPIDNLSQEVRRFAGGVGLQPTQIEATSNGRTPPETDPLTLFHRIREWLAPSSFTSRYDAARQKRTAGTSCWIFDTSEFQDWASHVNTDQPCHLSIRG